MKTTATRAAGSLRSPLKDPQPRARLAPGSAGPRPEPSAGTAPRAEFWRAVPLECLVCALAVIAAAGLKLAGLMP
ncbi:hypothetical protein [Methylobacterium oxalidis]|uniref:Uncharacterized protein n=1 Tax=Methylobacterium oxalidis TaxID=944322 RepID=A0A512J0Z5_9HYPH|nr:hypothetical protein [Methylobacterium oxalidis]GEP03632.1 hypothetical protein MOX02_16700 [Methylobacterium oxalidis]GJE34339.1 hypothetical protein LDDCCGHA_4550 [Methylobacterium oxalidis]GLS64959.1 hypothetical protein GCM10007888_33400 [Methylobacterium oxalidis]